ncbi:GSCFA domain-containing protein [Flavobacterium sp. SM2513]|uniref:GSCFA domain-containing protein n=1 Tax=Flavobacterium sp. SM2513 TaxID=3424766 RepID=UPI003D7FA562
MNFFTKVPISASTNPISYDSKIVSIGSCFAENMGEKFHFYQFQNVINPFGIIFNPISIEKLIQRAVEKEYFSEKDIFSLNERWHCFEIHSDLSLSNKKLFLNKLNETLDFFREKISTATHFIITLGTSWVYKTMKSNKIVANCHKVPQKEFTKNLLSTLEISESLQHCIGLISKVNPKCQFIFTISPVRHIKDGFVENQVSKSHLISAVYKLIEQKTSTLNYFPSYEIMMDELRDYRFYKQDLLHPNATAIDYIWSRFIATTVEKNSLSTMNEVEMIQKGLQHRSFNSESISHQKFLENLNGKILKIQLRYPFMKF